MLGFVDGAQLSAAMDAADQEQAQRRTSLVEQFVEAVAGTRNLLLVNFRPEYHADWMGRSWYRQLPLAPLGPDAIRKRLEWSQSVAERLGNRIDPRRLIEETLGETVGDTTRRMVNGADSRKQGLTLALMAPEFQRR